MSRNAHIMFIKLRILMWPWFLFLFCFVCLAYFLLFLIKHLGFSLRACHSLATPQACDIHCPNQSSSWEFKSGVEISTRNWFSQLLSPEELVIKFSYLQSQKCPNFLSFWVQNNFFESMR